MPIHDLSAHLLTSRRLLRSGCSPTGTYTARTTREEATRQSSESDEAMVTIGRIMLPGETRRQELPVYKSRRWVGLSAHAHGTSGYMCPQACFDVGNVSAEMADVRRFGRGHCPWY